MFISLIHFEFISVYGVIKCSFHSLIGGWPVFPAPLDKEIVFSLFYILASFVKDKVSIGAWIAWASSTVAPGSKQALLLFSP